MLRTLGGKNLGKCRLRAHQHPLLPPLPKPRDARCVQERVVERVLRNALHPASILDFRPRLANQCKDFLVYPLFRASIRDFRAKLTNRCKLFPVYTILRAVILDFRPRFANHCSTFVAAVWNGPPAAVVAATKFRVRF